MGEVGTRRAFLAIAFAMLLLVAPGCGGSGDSTSSQASGAGNHGAAVAQRPANGERSIEDFGEEAAGSDRSELLSAFHGYLAAVAARDYAGACERLSTSVRGALSQFIRTDGPSGCSALLPKLLGGGAAAVARQQAGGEVTKVRLSGDQGFVVFHAPGARLFQQTLVREGDTWKLGTAIPSVLVP